MIYDLDQARIDELTDAFRAGELRGRQSVDEDVMAECVALRVRLAARQDFWQAAESLGLAGFATLTILGVWGGLAYLVFG